MNLVILLYGLMFIGTIASDIITKPIFSVKNENEEELGLQYPALAMKLGKYVNEHENDYQLYKSQYDVYPIMQDAKTFQFNDLCNFQFISNFELIKAGINQAFELDDILSDMDVNVKQKYGLDLQQIEQYRPIYDDIVSSQQNQQIFVDLMNNGLNDCRNNLKKRMSNLGLQWVTELDLYEQFMAQNKQEYDSFKKKYDKYGQNPSIATQDVFKCKQQFIDRYEFVKDGINGNAFNKDMLMQKHTLDEMKHGLQHCKVDFQNAIDLYEKLQTGLQLYKKFFQENEKAFQSFEQKYNKYNTDVWHSMVGIQSVKDEFVNTKCKPSIDLYRYLQNGINNKMYDKNGAFRELIINEKMINIIKEGFQDCQTNLQRRIDLIQESMQHSQTLPKLRK